jgi:CO dehydrogenase/acetyl-CoA synthase beta subunit
MLLRCARAPEEEEEEEREQEEEEEEAVAAAAAGRQAGRQAHALTEKCVRSWAS